MTFWLKSSKSGNIMSSGSFTDNRDGPGFRLTYKRSLERYEFVVETRRRKWLLYIHGQKVDMDSYDFSVAETSRFSVL